MKTINAALRKAGVVWHPCQECGTDWPFPTGCDPSWQREFHCAVCVHALWARLQRALQEEDDPDGQDRMKQRGMA